MLSIIIAPRHETLPLCAQSQPWSMNREWWNEDFTRHHRSHHTARSEMRREVLGLRALRASPNWRHSDETGDIGRWLRKQELIRLERIRTVWRMRPAGLRQRERLVAHGQQELGETLI